jgi:methionyl-tRNA formyltransferase
MRIALVGQAAFGADVLQGLLKQGQEVAGVFCPPDRGGKVDPLKDAAVKAGLPVFQPARMKDQEAYTQMVSLSADLAVLAFVTDIVPPKVFNAPRLGSICYHPSILPRYRGASAINWAVINGETETGLTIFWVDQGIDTGDVLLQKKVEIGPNETTGTTPKLLTIRPAMKKSRVWTGPSRAARSSISSGAATHSPGPPPPSKARK